MLDQLFLTLPIFHLHPYAECHQLHDTIDMLQVKYTEDHCAKTEEGQCHLAPVAAKAPTPGHTCIFNKIQSEPIGYQGDMLAIEHIGFYPNFEALVHQ